MFWKALGDFILPRTCLVCGRRLGLREEFLCLHCLADLPLTRNWERPHNPMADQYNALVERLRGDVPELYAQATSLLYYKVESPYKAIPQALKYHGNVEAGRHFGAMLGRYMAACEHWASVDTVIPVPLHRRRKWLRGYNQAEVLAREIATALGATLRTDVLLRPHRTPSQTRLSASERLRNVSGAFEMKLPAGAGRLSSGDVASAGGVASHDGAASPDGLSSHDGAALPDGVASSGSRGRAFEPRHILLVDDTFTTGATLAACHQTIRAALGPSVRISVATLAAVSG